MKKLHCIICGKYRKFGKLKLSYLLSNYLIILFVVSARMNMKKYLKKSNQLRY